MQIASFIHAFSPYLQPLINHSASCLTTSTHLALTAANRSLTLPASSPSCSSSRLATNQHYSHSQAITSIFQSITTHSILPWLSRPSLLSSAISDPFLASSHLLTATHRFSQPLTYSFFLLSVYIPILARPHGPSPLARSASAAPLLVTHRGGLSSSFLCFSLLLNLP